MKRFSVQSSFKSVFAILLALSLSACYEGYKKPNTDKDGQSQKGGGGGGAGSKPFGFALIDVIKPTPEALTSSGCGRVPTSLAPVRLSEMERRIRGAAEVINAAADSIAVRYLDIDVANCQTFSSLQARATELLPKGSVSAELKGKPALHARIVLWFGDTARTYPPIVILNNEWPVFRQLNQDGFKRLLSINHFALTGPIYGFVWNWKNLSDANLNFIATTIADPPPTPEGISELNRTILKSTTDFANWLRERAGATL